MKTLSKLSAIMADDGKPSTLGQSGVHITVQQKNYWSRIRACAVGFFVESSDGGQVFIHVSEIMILAQTHEPRIIPPQPTKSGLLSNETD
jgi:hypothetical protein